ncbi:MAG: hypothetical protein H7A25_15815 [Leptospiraceae bacterium]|nr:hypothetical protein [Leptospiraceae bacterium]
MGKFWTIKSKRWGDMDTLTLNSSLFPGVKDIHGHFNNDNDMYHVKITYDNNKIVSSDFSGNITISELEYEISILYKRKKP